MAAVKLHITLGDQRTGLWAYRAALSRLGVEVLSLPADDAPVLALTDGGSRFLAGHPRFMSADALNIVLSRERLHETGLPMIPTTPIASPEDAPAGTIVKPRNSAAGGFVYQPHLGFPQEDLDISFAVNAVGDILPFACMHLTHAEAKKPLGSRMATPDETSEVLPGIQAACRAIGIRGGIHNVQFLQYGGQWCVIDWNPRPAFVHTQGLAAVHNYIDRPLAFMLGLPLSDESPTVFESRSYWSAPVPFERELEIRRIGLVPRRVSGVFGFPRISGVASSQAEMDRLFNQVEAML